MYFFDTVFPQLGVEIVSNNGKLPLQIKGPLRPRDITIDGSLSSQFLTGLLFAYAAAGEAAVSIRVNNLKSKPYIDLTLQVLEHFGWKVENRNYEEFYFPRANYNSGKAGKPQTENYYTVEGDWSGAAFLLVAGAIAGPVTVKGLDKQSTQADKGILQALTDCGADLSFGQDELMIGPTGTSPGTISGPASGNASPGLRAFHFNATDCPDLFPPLVALASYCAGTTVIEGVGRLAHKESNRALTLQEEFAKLGVSIELEGDCMLVRGGDGAAAGRIVKGATVHSRHDHRIAMACAVAALRAEGETIIEEAQAINKSYPDFYEHLQSLGAQVRVGEAIGNEP
jgi:3-phosphoshikimate 1-carboxyvinyltransferase